MNENESIQRLSDIKKGVETLIELLPINIRIVHLLIFNVWVII